MDNNKLLVYFQGNKPKVSDEVKVALNSEVHLTETYLSFHFVHEVAESFIPHPGRDVRHIAHCYPLPQYGILVTLRITSPQTEC